MLLEAVHLNKTFRSGLTGTHRVHAVDDVSFSVEQNTAFGLMGASGGGKSTLSRLILRLLSPDSGQILLDGHDIAGLKGKQLKAVRQTMQIVFQHPEASLNPQMTVAENLKEPLRIQQTQPRSRWDTIVAEKLDLVGLPTTLLRRYPHEISGGEAQRVVLARALVLDARFIVLDEPTSMLDVSVQAQIMELFATLQRELGLTYLFISHDLDLVRWLCRDIAFMDRGRIVEQGLADEVLSDPRHPFTQQIVESFEGNW